MTRPQLPVKHANPKIKRILETNPHPQVKYQMLNCQGREILVGRLKVETPTENGHAFILRRFDTGAVSLTTMYRAAFPLASELEERAELQWVKDNYDLSGNNGSSKETHITRLAGTWVNPALAVELADQYSLGPLIKIVVDAHPDPNATYKKSARAAAASSVAVTTDGGKGSITTNFTALSHQVSKASIAANAAPRSTAITVTSSRSTTKSLPQSSPMVAQPNPPKRRKEASPAPPTSDSSSSPLKAPGRRSNRAKSPAAKPVSNLTSADTPARSPKKQAEQTTPSSDKTVVDEESDRVEQLAAEELHDQDILEQKKLIEDLKAQRAAAAAEQEAKTARQAQEEADNEEAEETAAEAASKKRERDEDEAEYQFVFKEPEVGERAIATNRRVGLQMEPRTKSFAWGVAAFAVGMGAISLLPNFL